MERRSREKDKTSDDYILVRFIEDNIWFVSSKARIRKTEKGKEEAKWAPDRKWYEVEIHSQGDKASMTALLNEKTGKQPGGSYDDNIKDSNFSKRSWRKMCNVPLDSSIGSSMPKEVQENESGREEALEKTSNFASESTVGNGDRYLHGIYLSRQLAIETCNSIQNEAPQNVPDTYSNILENPNVDVYASVVDSHSPYHNPSKQTVRNISSSLVETPNCNSKLSTENIQSQTFSDDLSHNFPELSVNNSLENTIITDSFSTSSTKFIEKLLPSYQSPEKILGDISNTFLEKLDEAVFTKMSNNSPDVNYRELEYSINEGLGRPTSNIKKHTSKSLQFPENVTLADHLTESETSKEISLTELSNVSNDSEIIYSTKVNKICTSTTEGEVRILPARTKKTCISYNFDDSDTIEDPFASINSSDGYQPSASDADTSKNSNESPSPFSTTYSTPAEDINLVHLKKDTPDAEINSSKERLKENMPINKVIYKSKLSDNMQNKEICEGTNDPGGVFIDEVQMAILSGDKSSKRKWDKQFYCVYCDQYFAKLPRHWYRKHSKEAEVAQILSLHKTSDQRKQLIAALQNRSIFKSNSNAMKTGEGTIVPKRRQRNSGVSLKSYAPCEYCYQLFSKAYVSRHQRTCKFKIESDTGNKRKSIRSKNILMLPVGPQISEKFKEQVLSKMSGDDIFVTIRNDPTILKYGETEFRRLGHDNRNIRTIIDRCRELGRLLIKARAMNPNIIYLRQLINANNYQLFKRSVYEVSEFNDEANTFGIPSIALKIGMTMKKIATMLKGDCLEDEILTLQIPQLNSFLAIMESKWTTDVTCHAYRTLNERRWNQPKRLPLARDIQKLNSYLLTRAQSIHENLKTALDTDSFKELTEITLVMTVIPNRRRVGEVQYMKLIDYEKAKTADADSDVFGVLTDAEKQLSKALIRLVVRGKKGRGVPVLMTEKLQSYMSILINLRSQCGVLPSNPYLFPSLRHTSGFYQAHRLINQFSVKAGCEAPQNITSTKLRKHIAVMVQLLNLKENELDSLAQFMGHDISVHRQYYRLQDETVQLAKISKILINMEKGNLNIMKGKSLDEIEVNEEFGDNEDNEEEDLEEELDLTSVSPDLSSPGTSTQESVGTSVSSKNIPQPKETSLKKANKNSAKVRKIVTKKKWSETDKKLTLKYFAKFIDMRTVPGIKEITKFLEKNPTIEGRPWRQVKDFVYNEIKKQKKITNM